jgi:hypothetical protein
MAADDRGLGLSLVFGLLALGAAVYTVAAPTQLLTAWGFAAAVTLSALATAAIQVFE